MLSNAYRSSILVTLSNLLLPHSFLPACALPTVTTNTLPGKLSMNEIIMSQQPLSPFGMTTCGQRTRSATLIWLPLKQSGAHGALQTGWEGWTGVEVLRLHLGDCPQHRVPPQQLAPRAVYFWPSHRHGTLRSLYWLRDDVISMGTALDDASEEFPFFNR